MRGRPPIYAYRYIQQYVRSKRVSDILVINTKIRAQGIGHSVRMQTPTPRISEFISPNQPNSDRFQTKYPNMEPYLLLL